MTGRKAPGGGETSILSLSIQGRKEHLPVFVVVHYHVTIVLLCAVLILHTRVLVACTCFLVKAAAVCFLVGDGVGAIFSSTHLVPPPSTTHNRLGS